MFGRGNTNGIWIGIGIAAFLSLLAGWKMLKKAGENPWKILIPIYGGYCLYKIASAEGAFWGTFAVSVISSALIRIVGSNITRNTFYLDKPDTTPITIIAIISGVIMFFIQIYFAFQLADAFGKGKGFGVGLFLLFPIFAMILGFGDAVYGGRSGLERVASVSGTWKCPRCGAENLQSRGTCQNCGEAK